MESGILMGLFFVVAFMVVFGGGGMAFLASLKTRRAIRAGQETREEDGCVACGSPDVDEIAPRVWRCRRCGFTGGAGMADFHRIERMAAIANMSPEERQRTGVEDLQQAQRLLMKADATLDQAATLARQDTHRNNYYDHQADCFKQSLLVSAMGDIQQAEQLIMGAGSKLGIKALQVRSHEIDASSMAFALDGGIDNISANSAVAGHIGSAHQRAKNLASLVERTLVQVAPAGPGRP